MTTAVIFTLILALIIVTLAAFGGAIRTRELTKLLTELRASNDEWEKVAMQKSATAQAFLKAARIIEINANGRYLNITVARGDTMFTIETMKLLSDDVKGWRAQCGLTE